MDTESMPDETANMADPEKTENHSPVQSAGAPQTTFPDGGFQAWLVVAGAFMACFCSFGYSNSFGLYQAYYISHQLSHKTPSQVAWIGSLQLFFMFFAGPLAGPLFDKYGARAVMVPASVIFVFCIMMTSLCKEYYQFILAQGVLGGISNGLILTPALTIAGQYFLKKRATAMGIVVSGSSIGAVIIPVMLNRLFNNSSLGFGWTVRVTGFLILGLLAIACIGIKERLPPRRGAILLPSAFLNLPYTFTVVGLFFMFWGLYTPFFYITTYAQQHGMSTSLAYYMVAVLNAASFFGRVLPGILADKLGKFNVIIIVGVSTAILEFCWIKTHNNAGIIAFTAVFGFTSGAVISLLSAVVAETAPNMSSLGTYIGMAMGICSFGGLTGTPITGAMITAYGRYTEAAVFSGVVVMAGSACMVIAKILHERNTGKREN